MHEAVIGFTSSTHKVVPIDSLIFVTISFHTEIFVFVNSYIVLNL